MSFLLAAFTFFGSFPVAAAPTQEAGVSTSTTLVRMSDPKLDSRLRDIKAMGATWIRVDYNWALIQPHNHSDYEWGGYDRVARAARKHNLKIMATLAYTPVWARNAKCEAVNTVEMTRQKCSPRSTEEFGRFARASVIRYRGLGVHTWEIWNEPNLIGHLKVTNSAGRTMVDPQAFARMANAVAREIRRHDNKAFIITGGLGPMFDPQSPIGMRQNDFLAKLLPSLERHLFDAVAVHPYSWPNLPELAAVYNAFYTTDQGPAQYNLRQTMARLGWGSKQLWATEFGASTTGLRIEGTPLKLGRPDHVTEAKQAQIITQGIREWYDKPNAGPIFVHADSDQWLSSHKNEGGFGMRRKDGTKKPAYTAFQKITKEAPKPAPKTHPALNFLDFL